MQPEEYLFFSGRPEQLKQYVAIAVQLHKAFPLCTVRVQRTQLTYDYCHPFCCVSVPSRKRMAIAFFLDRPIIDSGIANCIETYPGRYTHHFFLETGKTLSYKQLSWLAQAWNFAGRK